MNFENVLIVTYGRSGSTLLQGLLNSIDGCLVRGENHNFCYGLYQAYALLRRTHEENMGGKSMVPTDPWFGAPQLDLAGFQRECYWPVRKQLLADVDPATVSCLGFKEIRYQWIPELEDYLWFLEGMFPKVAFVFLTRDHKSVAKSAWWRDKDPQEVHKDLQAFEDRVKTFGAHRQNFFHIDYEALATQGPAIGELFAFLGAEYDAAKVSATLATPHSYTDSRAAEDPRQITVEALPGDGVREVFIDPLREGAQVAEAISLSGVVLPPVDVDPATCLVLRGLGEELAVAWHLPSPLVGARFEGDAFAQSARFWIEHVPVSERGERELCIKYPDGWYTVVARLVH